MFALENRRPRHVTCAAILAGLYAGPLLFVSAMTGYRLLNGVAGTFGGGSHNRFELKGVLWFHPDHSGRGGLPAFQCRPGISRA